MSPRRRRHAGARAVVLLLCMLVARTWRGSWHVRATQFAIEVLSDALRWELERFGIADEELRRGRIDRMAELTRKFRNSNRNSK